MLSLHRMNVRVLISIEGAECVPFRDSGRGAERFMIQIPLTIRVRVWGRRFADVRRNYRCLIACRRFLGSWENPKPFTLDELGSVLLLLVGV